MTRPTFRLAAAVAAIAAVVVVAVPVLGVDPSRSPSTGSAPTAAPPSGPASPAATPAAAGASASPSDDGQGEGHGKPDKAAKSQDAPDRPVTLSGTVGKAAGDDAEFTLTVGSTVYTLEAGPKWWWGDASPLAAAVGKHVTIDGELEDGSTDVDVIAIDGKQLRPAGRPPWAGGWKVVGPKHPGWAQWKVDKQAGKSHGHPDAADQDEPSPTP